MSYSTVEVRWVSRKVSLLEYAVKYSRSMLVPWVERSAWNKSSLPVLVENLGLCRFVLAVSSLLPASQRQVQVTDQRFSRLASAGVSRTDPACAKSSLSYLAARQRTHSDDQGHRPGHGCSSHVFCRVCFSWTRFGTALTQDSRPRRAHELQIDHDRGAGS